ncbi:putative prophage primase [Xenorhabdus nematophila ATCC 19061]|uniref:Prophage primase n=1 Tax=Xenorhabdus nematophila (strain ATCC 19061 / DSM 3370 / CCUG 14189 / LMG 1036 / NCIMB 9965 / AN6) TaxID=406817 RepID=D3VCF3_XENNA|nr:putative prophage primase [Xenorhabdus nematophila ATCC 19061]
MALPLSEPKPAKEKPRTVKPIAERIAALVATSVTGESQYLAKKGLQCPNQRLLKDGSLLLVIQALDGTVTGTQTIKLNGEKRLVSGSKKKSSFIPLCEIAGTPDTFIITEGYATALTISQLHEGVILAAMDEGNLPTVAELVRKQWPNAKIILAADNDWHEQGERDKNGKLKKNVGKIAAEKAAQSVDGWVSLPPTKEKADWDDYRQRHDIEAAKQVFSEGLYQVGKTVSESKPVVINLDERREKERDPLKPHVDTRKDGIYWVEPKEQNGEIIAIEKWLSDYMEVVGIGNDGGEGYLIIKLSQEGTSKHTFEALPSREIGMPIGWARLRSRGINITTKNSLLPILSDHLQRSGDRRQWEVTQTAGWHCGAYVMPDGEIIGQPDMPVAFCGGTSAVAGYVVRGTADEWKNRVASLMKGNRSMMLGVLVGLAAPLNSLTGGSCFGVHLFAQSSAGKTTTVEATSSLYGDPEELKLSWHGTHHGLNNEAAARNDGFLPIDEIGQSANPKEVANSAYSLFNGVGKIQGKREGGNRAVIRWKIAALSTGEEDLETFLIKGGITPKAGQLVRLLSVPFIDTEFFNGYEDGDAHAKAIKRESKRYCGTAGRAWILWLSENQEQAIETVTRQEKAWLDSLPEEASAQVKRVAVRFALLDAAGELATPITGWSKEECHAAIKQSFDDWLADFGIGNREKYQVVTRARDFIQKHGLSRFQPYTYGKLNGNIDTVNAMRINHLAGYLVHNRRDDGQVEYHIIPSVFEEEILQGLQKKSGFEALEEAGMLIKAEKDRFISKTISVNGTQGRFVVLVFNDED